MQEITVGLFNDSFPPTIDGVANVTLNYARVIQRSYGKAVVATPTYPNITDAYDFDVVRYPSLYIGETVGYRAGYPFDPAILRVLEQKKIDIIHTHAPFASAVLARVLRSITGAPIVFTYHTKFDIEVKKMIASDMLRQAAAKMILSNIEACDEVWVVSEGAGENLQKFGYTGSYYVMENGTDFDKGRADSQKVQALRDACQIPKGVPVFLFVGRLMWYKGIRLSVDALRQMKKHGADFRFILVGDGGDRNDIENYVRECGLWENSIFTGAVEDREELREFFSLANLFLFPSAFDTNGMVVREAAACACPSVVLRGSAAAEGIEDNETGILIRDTPEDMLDAVRRAFDERDQLVRIGENASRKLVITWEQAVDKACHRYAKVLERCGAGAKQEDKASLSKSMSRAIFRLMDGMDTTRNQIKGAYDDTMGQWRDRMDESREFNETNRKITQEFRERQRQNQNELYLMRMALRARRKQQRQEKKAVQSEDVQEKEERSD